MIKTQTKRTVKSDVLASVFCLQGVYSQHHLGTKNPQQNRMKSCFYIIYLNSSSTSDQLCQLAKRSVVMCENQLVKDQRFPDSIGCLGSSIALTR